MAENVKIKIKHSVVLGGRLHHKIGSVVSVPDGHAKILIADGWAEQASANTPLTPGASVVAPIRPVNPRQAAELAAKEKTTDAKE